MNDPNNNPKRLHEAGRCAICDGRLVWMLSHTGDEHYRKSRLHLPVVPGAPGAPPWEDDPTTETLVLVRGAIRYTSSLAGSRTVPLLLLRASDLPAHDITPQMRDAASELFNWAHFRY